MVEIIQQRESKPAVHPGRPHRLSRKAAIIPPPAVWARIEHWTRARWGKRTVEWITEGGGVFVHPLYPATLETAEHWTDQAWQPVTPGPSPFGIELSNATHRLTYTVGANNPPNIVFEAYRRLAEYWAETQENAGYSRVTDGDYSFERPASSAARALHLSGAADLLRCFR